MSSVMGSDATGAPCRAVAGGRAEVGLEVNSLPW